MKIMIVDDEIIIREGLARVIDWHELGLTLLAPAESAEEALRRIPEEKPELLLTDIRMERVDGLALAQEAKAMLPDLEVIVLTGYDDFAYTQRAIRQNVSDYLLKTSRPEEIIQAALRAVQRLRSKREERSQELFKEKEIRDRWFEKWVIGGEAIADPALIRRYLPKLCRGPDESAPLQVILFRAGGWGNTEKSAALLRFAVDNMLRELIPCETLIAGQLIVAAMKTDSRHATAAPDATLLSRIERLLKCTLSSAAGMPVDRPEQLAASYRSALHLTGYWELLAPERVLTNGMIEGRKGGRTVCTRREEAELSRLLLAGDSFRLKQWVHSAVSEQLRHAEVTRESYTSYIQSLALAGFRWLERVSADPCGGDGPTGASAAFVPGTGESLCDDLQQYLHSLMEAYHSRTTHGQTGYVRLAMAFVREHLGSKQLGLTQAARYVSVHPGHLSEVFKRETGVTFGDFVTRERMERARELLADPSAKVGEIARAVGYEDVKYFGQLFKKHYSQTPTEYREKLIAHP